MLSKKKAYLCKLKKNTQNTTAMDTTVRTQNHPDNALLQLRQQASELALQIESKELLAEVITLLRDGFRQQQHQEEPTVPDGYMSLEQFEDELIKAVSKKL